MIFSLVALEDEKKMIEFIKIVSPGTSLRGVIDDIVRSGHGAIIVLDSPEIQSQRIIEGGFKMNCRFSQQKLFELCKMDGAIILSDDLKKILFSNVLLTPNSSIYTSETGTRHKAAERTAKQAKTLVITVSERRNKTTLYYENHKYSLRSTDEIRSKISSMLQVLEKQREILDENLRNLNILEMSDLVSVGDVCGVLQKAEMILKISESVKRNFVEIGKEGNIIHMRYRELLRGVEKVENGILRDYSVLSLKKSKTLLESLTLEGLLDDEAVSRLILEKSIKDNLSPKGFRFLSNLTLSQKEISQIIKKFGDLKSFIVVKSSDFEEILKNRSEAIYKEVEYLREQILSGKVVC